MCEETITAFLRDRFGFERIPVPTEAVTMLIERDAADLDLATNLSDDSTKSLVTPQFERGQKPRVTIARELWEQRHRNNRLRTTLDPRIWPRYAAHMAVRQVRRCPRSAPLLLAEPASNRAGVRLV